MPNLTGQFGTDLLNFYQANALWINLLVLAYGAWVVLSWINLKNIRKVLLLALIDQLRSQVDPASGKVVLKKDGADLVIPWDRVVGQAGFPFIAKQNGLLPHRVSIETARAMLPDDYLVAEAVRILRPPQKKKSH
jgi:hypothetical protein